MEPSIDLEQYWQERQKLEHLYRNITRQERLVRQMERPPLTRKRAFQREMRLLRSDFKRHLLDAALQAGRAILKIVGLL